MTRRSSESSGTISMAETVTFLRSGGRPTVTLLKRAVSKAALSWALTASPARNLGAQHDLDHAAGGAVHAVFIGREQLEIVATLLESQRGRLLAVALDFASRAAGLGAELQRGEAVAMHHRVHVDRIRRQRLAEHHARLAMRLRALADEVHSRADAGLALQFTPDETEGVFRAPDVVAGRADEIDAAGAVEGNQRLAADFADFGDGGEGAEVDGFEGLRGRPQQCHEDEAESAYRNQPCHAASLP